MTHIYNDNRTRQMITVSKEQKLVVMHYSSYIPFSEGSPELAAMEGTGAKNCINN